MITLTLSVLQKLEEAFESSREARSLPPPPKEEDILKAYGELLAVANIPVDGIYYRREKPCRHTPTGGYEFAVFFPRKPAKTTLLEFYRCDIKLAHKFPGTPFKTWPKHSKSEKTRILDEGYQFCKN